MMRSTLALLAVALAVTAQDDPQSKLGSENEAEALAAVDALIQRGDPKDLETLATGENKRVAWHARMALEEIKSRQILKDDYESTPRVTLQVKGATLAEAAKTLQAQTKRALKASAADAKVTVDIQNRPYAEAIMKIAKAAGAGVFWEDGLTLRDAGSQMHLAPAYAYGDVAVLLKELSLFKHNDFTAATSTLTVGLAVVSTFTRRPIEARHIHVVEAAADGGAALESISDEVSTSLSLQTGSDLDRLMSFSLEFKAPKKVTKLATLRGYGEMLMAKSVDTIEVKGPFKSGTDAKGEKNDYKVKVSTVLLDEDSVELQVSFKKPSGSTSELGSDAIVIKLFDKDGTRFEGVEVYNSEDGDGFKYDVSCVRAPGVGAPDKVAIEYPTATLSRNFYFEFKDVSLR